MATKEKKSLLGQFGDLVFNNWFDPCGGSSSPIEFWGKAIVFFIFCAFISMFFKVSEKIGWNYTILAFGGIILYFLFVTRWLQKMQDDEENR